MMVTTVMLQRYALRYNGVMHCRAAVLRFALSQHHALSRHKTCVAQTHPLKLPARGVDKAGDDDTFANIAKSCFLAFIGQHLKKYQQKGLSVWVHR